MTQLFATAQLCVWVVGSCTALAAASQIVVLGTYPLLANNKKLTTCGRRRSSAAIHLDAKQIPRGKDLRASNLEIFFLGLAVGSLIADALFHLIPGALTEILLRLGADASSGKAFLAPGSAAMFGMLLVSAVEWCAHSASRLIILPHDDDDDDANFRPDDPENQKVKDRGHEASPTHPHAIGGCAHGFSHLFIEDDDVLRPRPVSQRAIVMTDSVGHLTNGEASPLEHHDLLSGEERTVTTAAIGKDCPTTAFEKDNFAHTYASRQSTEASSSSSSSSFEPVPNESHGHRKNRSAIAAAWTNLFATGLHNLVDGFAIGIAFLASRTSGMATSIAIFAHDVPSQIATFVILLRGGITPLRAFMLNFLMSWMATIGGVLALAGIPKNCIACVQMLAAGNFLCLALAILTPQLREMCVEEGGGARQILFCASGLCVGVALMVALVFLE